MRNIKIYFWAAICCSLLWSCERQNNINEIPPSNLRSIVSFVLNTYQNEGNVTVKLVGTIDEEKKIIKLKIPSDLRLDSIRPEIMCAPWASTSPKNLEYIDFTPDTVKYTVIAESGKKAVYSLVKDGTYKYTKSNVYAVSFTNIIDPGTGVAVQGVCTTSAITMNVPVGTDITKIMTNLEFFPDSRLTNVIVKEKGPFVGRSFTNPNTVDYTKPVTFIVTSQDSLSTTSYTITAKYK